MGDESSQQRVYIVDDDRAVGASLSRLLDSVGLPSQTFFSPQDALERLTSSSSGCLIMDVRLPVMSGVEAYQLLKGRGIWLPVVFLTAHQDLPTAVRAMKAGASDVLLKPCNSQVLIDAVHAALAQDRQRRETAAVLSTLQQRWGSLTPREREVMRGVVAGKPNKEIAWELGTTEKTIKVHRSEVMRKMAAHSLPDLVRSADRLDGLGDAPVSGATSRDVQPDH
jgi:FixJ family two-component response regulator